MKKLLILNGLILSGLTLSAQNLVNNQDNNVYASNVQSVNYTTVVTNVSPQTNVSNNTQMTVVQVTGNRGRGSATGNLGNTSNNNNKQIQVQTQTQVTNKPKQQKTVQVNNNPVINDDNVNTLDNNVGNQSNPNRGNEGNDVNRGGNLWVNDNIENSNPQVNNGTNKTVATKQVVVMEEFKGTDFKPIGLSGRDYSNGGKMKKGFRNIPRMEKSKVKHKKKPGYKKVKYHTSKCAKW